MLKRILLCLLLLVLLLLGWTQLLGSGDLGDPWYSEAVTPGPRPGIGVSISGVVNPQILFGDLHTHTSLSLDAYVFGTGLVKGGGVVTPADACDFARYCSALDFWSINDHAESLTPRAWADTVASIRDCNDNAGDPGNPDIVSFVGWEWSNSEKDDVASHYGHKNVIFRSWEKGQVPTRPIAAAPQYVTAQVPAIIVGLLNLVDEASVVADLGFYLDESKSTPACSDGIPVRQLSSSCREVALTPQSLYRKLDEWGFDSLVIPHGLAWGTTNPLTGDFKAQMDQHEQRYQKLLEVYSGHGSSEQFDDFQRVTADEAGEPSCPLATKNFTPCCQQAAKIVRDRCELTATDSCDEQVASAVKQFLLKGFPGGRKVLDTATPEDWEGCGQLQNSFQPSSAYVPRLSAQYNLALGFDENGQPKRAKLGLIGSSDGHQGRPGSSYKESNRLLYTDHKDTGGENVGMAFLKSDKESGGFYYTGGLVGVHAQGRDRDSIWQGLNNRNVYATSGGRMLVWFDLLNGPTGENTPMGSEVYLRETPRFRVRALGEFEQLPGCPDFAIAALGNNRIESLCGGECYRPAGDERRAITRIEIVRIRPQVKPDENIAPLIEDNWRVFDCPAEGGGCEVEFDDPEYAAGGRSTLYYARIIQESESLIVGDPFGCEYNDAGECTKRNYCIGDNAKPENNCLSEAEPRAWTSPIFIEFDR